MRTKVTVTKVKDLASEIRIPAFKDVSYEMLKRFPGVRPLLVAVGKPKVMHATYHRGQYEFGVWLTAEMAKALGEAERYVPRDKQKGDFLKQRTKEFSKIQVDGGGKPGLGEALVTTEGKIVEKNHWIQAIGDSKVAQFIRFRVGVSPDLEGPSGNNRARHIRLRLALDGKPVLCSVREWPYVSGYYRHYCLVRNAVDTAYAKFLVANRPLINWVDGYLPTVINREAMKTALFVAVQTMGKDKMLPFLKALKNKDISTPWVAEYLQIPVLARGKERDAVWEMSQSFLIGMRDGKRPSTKIVSSRRWDKTVGESVVEDQLHDQNDVAVVRRALGVTREQAKRLVGYARSCDDFEAALKHLRGIPKQELVFLIGEAKRLARSMTTFSLRAALRFVIGHYNDKYLSYMLGGITHAMLVDSWNAVRNDSSRRSLTPLEQLSFDLPWLETYYQESVAKIKAYEKISR